MFKVEGYAIKVINAVARLQEKVTCLEFYGGESPTVYLDKGVVRVDQEKCAIAAVRCTYGGIVYRIDVHGPEPDLETTFPFVEEADSGILRYVNEAGPFMKDLIKALKVR